MTRLATYYDALNDFFKSLGTERLASSAQLVYLHLLQLNNRSGNGGYVYISDRELNELTQLSRPTVTKAKQILKNRGLIDFKTDAQNPRAGTSYELLFFGKIFSQSVSQSLSQSLSQSVSQSEDVPNIRVREDFKTEDVPSFNPSAQARAPVEWNAETEETLSRLWVSNNGAPVTAELLSTFQTLAGKHGLPWLEAIIREASASYGGRYTMSLKYFRGCVERKLTGGEKRGKDVADSGRGKVVTLNGGRPYELPKRTGDEPWLKYRRADGAESSSA